MIYQVSYVIRDPKNPGEIVNSDHYPRIGELVTLKGRSYRVVEVKDLIPPRAKFCYVHALLEPVK